MDDRNKKLPNLDCMPPTKTKVRSLCPCSSTELGFFGFDQLGKCPI